VALELRYSVYLLYWYKSANTDTVFTLSFAEKGYMPPYISLDIPWRPFRPFTPYPSLSVQHLPRT